MRSAIKGALIAKGFRGIIEVTTMIALHEVLERDGADLVVTTSKLGVEDVSMLLREMRHHRLGNNPFVAAVMLLESPEKDDLARVVNAGVDDVLLMPVSTAQLIARVENIRRSRKAFVYTHDYVGPDRRKEVRPGSAPALTYEPPNPLKLREDPVVDEGRFNGLIRNGLVIHRRYIMAVAARQMEWLAGQVAIGCRDDNVPLKETVTHVARLTNVGQELTKRVQTDEFKEARLTLNGVLDLVRDISADPRAAKVDKLANLVEAAKTLKGVLAIPADKYPAAPAKTW